MTSYSSAVQVVVFLQTDLGIGGIENYIYRTFCLLRNTGVKLIWVSGKESYADPVYRDILTDGTVEIWKNKIDAEALRRMTFGKANARITFASSYINWYAMAEEFKRSCKWCPVENFFLVNHFTGWMNYLETACPKIFCKTVRKRMSRIFAEMSENENIRYFSKDHISSMEEHYNYKEKRPFEECRVPPCARPEIFDAERAGVLFDRKDFNLLAVSRFDFPHKGFLIGLIRIFGELKEEYSQLRMTIVGYGNGETEVKNAINALPEAAQKAVTLCDACSPEKLKEYYRDANLNVGVAGCCSGGAKIGTLSLPARNYCMECETYGFYPESKDMTTSVVPGEPVKPYIETVLALSREEYIQKCKDCYDAYAEQGKETDRITDIRNRSAAVLKKRDCRYVRRVFRYVMLKTKFTVIRRAIKRNGGLAKTIKKHLTRD